MALPFSTMASRVNICRSSVLPLGSPIMEVPPPSTAMGRCPARASWAMAISGTMLPT
jgi:hypothetical protein